ncbi:MAG: tRNA (adenosine(37)-N6)-threonylcarbamoyltransferase complex ATPase subunit type 1 TsaE [Candidatus Pacebacteria bacterium]|nr:tRNA (adenosine(37)-N6)-threonylcarbamoyltransferase complex ATPase subunit type 1 TsaE [Candidatus Paceibacterota bacterium]
MRRKHMTATHLDHTKAFAAHVIRELASCGPGKQATVIGLYGELGAGKTTFTKEAALLLGVRRTVSSPTFVLERIYTLSPKYTFSKLIHIDAYRLKDGTELAHLGWAELLADPKNLIFIEWPEKVMDVMPVRHIGIFFTHKGENERTIELRRV